MPRRFPAVLFIACAAAAALAVSPAPAAAATAATPVATPTGAPYTRAFDRYPEENPDGKPDTWETYSAAGELLERRIDNQPWGAPDGKVDVTEFYRKGELILRMARTPESYMYKVHMTLEIVRDGVVVVWETDQEMDGRYENRVFYPGLSRDDLRIENSRDNDGSPDEWQLMRDKNVVRIEKDRNHDGRVDYIHVMPEGLFHDSTEYRDDDFDGTFEKLIRRRFVGMGQLDATSLASPPPPGATPLAPLFSTLVATAPPLTSAKPPPASKPAPPAPLPFQPPPPSGYNLKVVIAAGLAGLLLGLAAMTLIVRLRRASPPPSGEG